MHAAPSAPSCASESSVSATLRSVGDRYAPARSKNGHGNERCKTHRALYFYGMRRVNGLTVGDSPLFAADVTLSTVDSPVETIGTLVEATEPPRTGSDSPLPTTGTVLATQQCIAGDAVANVV
jgi:hypothetical protein